MLLSINLRPCKNAPCIFHGEILPGKPPLYLGVYIDDFIYFSTDKTVEKAFETKLSALTDVDFIGDVSHFLGIKFTWTNSPSSLSVHLSQGLFVENLAYNMGLDPDSKSAPKAPYCSGLPIDSIPTTPMSTSARADLKLKMQQIMGSLQ